MTSLPSPTETLSASDVQRTRGPFVYGWRRGDRYRYIGATRRGLPRLVERHHAITAGGGLLLGDAIDIWIPEDGESAFALEARLIAEHQPELNRQLRRAAVAARDESIGTAKATGDVTNDWSSPINLITVSVSIEYLHGLVVERADVGDFELFAINEQVLRGHGGPGDRFNDILDAAAELEAASERLQHHVRQSGSLERREDGSWIDINTGEPVSPPPHVTRDADPLVNMLTWLAVNQAGGNEDPVGEGGSPS